MSVLVENLTVRYGDLVAVDNVSFEAPTGSVTVILGPNGAGKTSTIEVCEGFRTGQGHVRVLGLDPVKQHQELTNRMGVMLQGGGVYPSARVKDVIKHFCALHDKGVDPTDLIQLIGLTARSKSTWRRLSGGEQQRLSLALALAAKPEVIFLDEPTSGVDIDGRDVIRDIILGLSQEGTTVLLASHDMAEHRYDFSFSGLKTAVARWVEAQQRAGRALLWDKQVDRELQSEWKEARVPQKAYVYGSGA